MAALFQWILGRNLLASALAQGEQLSQAECDSLMNDIQTLKDDSRSLRGEIDDLTKKILSIQKLTYGGHIVDGALVFGSAGLAKIGQVGVKRAWRKYADDVGEAAVEILANNTRKFGIYGSSFVTGVSGNISNLSDIPLSASEVTDLYIGWQQDGWISESQEYENEISENTERIGNLKQQWKDGGCERFRE